MRLLWIAATISLTGCSSPSVGEFVADWDADLRVVCPTELPRVSDLNEGPVPSVRTGTNWATSFSYWGSSECLDVTVTRGNELVPFTLDGTTVHFALTGAGLHSTQVALRTRPDDGRSMGLVVAVANPGEIEPCLTLARSCESLTGNDRFIACDDALFTRDGAQIATLDGGAWHVGNQLFAWTDGALRHIVVDGGLVETASIAAPRPAMWDAIDGRVAIWASDGGALYAFDGNAFEHVAPIVGALHGLAVQPDGGVLRAIDHSAQFACPLDGACAFTSRFVSSAALDGTRAWAVVTGGFRSELVTRFDQRDDGSWQEIPTGFTRPRIPVPLPRRLLLSHPWGLQLENETQVMRFDEGNRHGATSNLVWSSGGGVTRIWCQ